VTVAPQTAGGTPVRADPFPPNWTVRLIALLVVAYVVYAVTQVDLTWTRLIAGLAAAGHLLSEMIPPDFHRWPLLLQGVVESLQIAIIATVLGIALSLPIGFLAARNLMPVWVTGPTRFLVAACRSLHPIIVAILFVKAIGFGAAPGILALIVASIGFISKLFAEAIEEISSKQVEAVRATGAGFLNTAIYGVLPQVNARFVGFSLYQLDSNVRNSTMVGIVGAGGIGGTLFTAFQRFDYAFVLALLLSIIALVMLAELFSQLLRRAFLDQPTGRPAAGAATESGAARTWRRFTPVQRLTRFGIYLFILLALLVSLRTIDIIPEFLTDAPEQMADLLSRMWPIDFSEFQREAGHAMLETINIASLGTLITLAMALPVGVMATRSITKLPALNWLAHFILVASRSVNSLVWALLFIAMFGPGVLAGTFAIAFRSVGFVGKLFAESLEECHRGPIEALRAVGAPAGSILLRGYWPQVQPAFWSLALLRWDINVRESAVLGLVGAGGIGVALQNSIDFFQWNRVALILLVVFAVVIAAEITVNLVRRRMI
jgi:phosphonate ABC transporter permease subunit PhnE